MTIADILLCVVPTAADELQRLLVAADLARRLHARLDGVFVGENDGRESNWARSLFERAVAATSLETTWRVLDGHSNAALLFQARRADLSILPRSAVAGGPVNSAPEVIILGSGRPGLILPSARQSMSIGHTVLIAWKDSRESARAVHDAMPILENAERVVVVTVTAGDLEPLADRRLVDHLSDHGVKAELVRRYGDAPDEIAAEARRIDADLLVMGLHQGSDANPAGLGDVSTRFVRTTALPVFLSA